MFKAKVGKAAAAWGREPETQMNDRVGKTGSDHNKEADKRLAKESEKKMTVIADVQRKHISLLSLLVHTHTGTVLTAYAGQIIASRSCGAGKQVVRTKYYSTHTHTHLGENRQPFILLLTYTRQLAGFGGHLK